MTIRKCLRRLITSSSGELDLPSPVALKPLRSLSGATTLGGPTLPILLSPSCLHHHKNCVTLFQSAIAAYYDKKCR